MSENNYYKKFIKEIIRLSDADNWDDAKLEWNNEGLIYIEDDEEGTCLCGKNPIYKIYSIRNIFNNNVVESIGSKCIEKFEDEGMNNSLTIYDVINKIKSFIKNESNEIKCEFFSTYKKNFLSKKIIKALYKMKIISDFEYKLLINMFNKRSEMTVKQNSKACEIINEKIIPFFKNKNVNEIFDIYKQSL